MRVEAKTGEYIIYETEDGRFRLEHNGYRYCVHLVKSQLHNPLKYWRCGKRPGKGNTCSGRALLKNSKLILTRPHNHGPVLF